MKRVALAALLASAWAGSVQAGTIVVDTTGAGSENVFIGQSFTTTGAAFDNISFSFYDLSGNRQAPGTAYLFSSAYAGTPDGLASASANLIATGAGSGGAYLFDPSVQLAADTQYFLYSDTQMSLLGGGTYYNGGSFALSDDASSGFGPGVGGVPGTDVNFILEGSFADFTVPDDLAVIDSALAGAVAGPEYRWGQSFVTGDAAIDNVTFNFYSPDGSPIAPGRAYLFSSPYDGFVRDIQTATENLVGRSLTGGSTWVFDPSMQLAANTIYYLYSDAPAQVLGGNYFVTPDTRAYASDDFGSYFDVSAGSAQDVNYLLRGAVFAAPVPEPATWAMMLAGFLSIGGVLRSARRKARLAAVA